MKSCNEYMGMIDGASDQVEDPTSELSAHLQTCKACGDYRAAAIKTKALLDHFRVALSTPGPTDLALKSIEFRITWSRRQLFWSLVLIVACFAAPFGALVVGDPLPLGRALSFIAVGLISLILPWRILRKQAALTKMGRRKEAFYQNWRHEIQTTLREATAGAVFASLFSVTLLFLAAFAIPPPGNYVVLSVALLSGVGAIHAFVVELPALRNELALVREASGG